MTTACMSERHFKILLVEDNAADIYLVRKALTDAGLVFGLKVLEDGALALAFVSEPDSAAASALPDLILLDLNLPKADGLDVLAAIRANPRMAAVPVVIATSSSAPSERARAETLGVDGFLTKPPDLTRFMEMGVAIRELLFRPLDGARGTGAIA